MKLSLGLSGAVEKTRTSTGFRPQRPQRCASTNSATTAHPSLVVRATSKGDGGVQLKKRCGAGLMQLRVVRLLAAFVPR